MKKLTVNEVYDSFVKSNALYSNEIDRDKALIRFTMEAMVNARKPKDETEEERLIKIAKCICDKKGYSSYKKMFFGDGDFVATNGRLLMWINGLSKREKPLIIDVYDGTEYDVYPNWKALLEESPIIEYHDCMIDLRALCENYDFDNNTEVSLNAKDGTHIARFHTRLLMKALKAAQIHLKRKTGNFNVKMRIPKGLPRCEQAYMTFVDTNITCFIMTNNPSINLA